MFRKTHPTDACVTKFKTFEFLIRIAVPTHTEDGWYFTVKLTRDDVVAGVEELASEERWSKNSTAIYCIERGVEEVGTEFPDDFTLPDTGGSGVVDKFNLWTNEGLLLDDVKIVAENHTDDQNFSEAVRYYITQGLRVENVLVGPCPFCGQDDFERRVDAHNHIRVTHENNE